MGFQLKIDDIQISSDLDITGERKIIPDIQGHPVFMENTMYDAYKITPLQIQLHTSAANQRIEIMIPYSNKLSEIDASYARICFYDGISHWRILETKHDSENRCLVAKAEGTNLVLGLFLNDYWYSEYTQRLADEFPTWTKIRKSRSSNGQRFLNYFAMQFEGAKKDLEDIRKQKFIDKLDERMLAWVYAYSLPKITSSDDLVIYDRVDSTTRQTVPILSTLREFFYNLEGSGVIIDYEARVLYSLKYYPKISGEVRNIDNRQSFESIGTPHQLWNPFDEFGLLLGVKRLHLEDNSNYRERIKDAFRYPANSGDVGLTNALGRELNLIKRFTWKDDTKNLYIKGSGLDVRTLRLDGQPLEPNMYAVDRFGHIVIQAVKEGKEHIVSIIKDIYKYELYDKGNEELYRMMFTEDGLASDKLLGWVEYINQVAPVMWGRFNWDEGYWDTISKDLTGLGYVPNIWDSNIDSWKNYTFRVNLNKESIN